MDATGKTDVSKRPYTYLKNGAVIVQLDNALFHSHESPGYVEHYICLGAMLSSFSMVEKSTAWLLSALCGVDKIAMRAVVYPLRVDNAMSAAKRVIKANALKGKRIDRILQTLDQLQKINKTRNELLHSGASFSEGDADFTLTNDLIAYHPSILRSTTLKNIDLLRMKHDLFVISAIWLEYVAWRTKDTKQKDEKGR